MRKAVTYDDVLLVPQYSNIKSREDIDIGNTLCDNIRLEVPIIGAPMDTVTESEMAFAMARNGALGVIHRYNEIDEQAGMVQEIHHALTPISGPAPVIAAAVGVTGDYAERAMALCENGATVICIDVAHGHHVLVREALHRLRAELDTSVHLMAGNVATLEAFNDLADWGADSVRCNIGGGSICSTRTQTGHGLPGLQTVLDCAQSDRDAKIIADGGIRSSGDMVKALAAGADFVMVGSLLAGTTEAPGNLSNREKLPMKSYRGMASKDAQLKWHGRYSSNEGISTQIPYKGPMQGIIDDLIKGIRSGLSYSGARNLVELRGKARFVRQTPAGLAEGTAHILGRA